MNILLLVNERHQAMLIHDQKLDFEPAWVEFSRDARGIRLIGEDGKEYLAGVSVDATTLKALNGINDIMLVWMKNGDAQSGTIVTFINQYYESIRPEGANYHGGWSDTATVPTTDAG